MLLLDACFRFSGVTLLVLIAGLTIRDNRHWRSAPYLILTCLSVTGLFLGFTPEAFKLPDAMNVTARFLDIPHLVFVWLFALSLYSKDFQLRPVHWIVGLIYCLPIVWIRLAEFGLAPKVTVSLIQYVSVTSLLLMAHLVYATIGEWADDLLIRRRRTRIYFVLTIIAVTLLSAASEVWLVGRAETAKVISIWPSIAMAAIWLMTASSPARLFGKADLRGALSQTDAMLSDKLARVMTEDAAFRDPQLTIVSLAKRLGVTQHRLRALINGALGYQNFSSYLNDLRVAQMRTWLADPDKAHLPIQTLAMDSGYRSLSPFNRAFRETEGLTPSAYRKQHQKLAN